MSTRTAIITGASRGIGKEVAFALAEEGYRVCLLARSKEKLRLAAQEITQKYHLSDNKKPLYYDIDVTNSDAVNHAIKDFISQTQHIDVVFNNAGIFLGGTSDTNPDDFQAMLNTNLTGAFNIIHAVTPYLKKAKTGYIFNLASIAGKSAESMCGAYSASKFGLVGLSDALRKELLQYGIKVTAICPSVVATDMTAGMDLPDDQKIQKSDIAKTILYLLKLSPSTSISEIVIECPSIMAERHH